MANVGKTIKLLRVGKNMTQDELAEKLFVSRQTVSNYENGKSNPDIDVLVKIAEVLETDVNTLIYGEKEKEDKKKKIIRWLVSALLFIVFAFVVIKVEGQLKYYASKFYIMWPRLIVRAWGYPVIYMLAGWLFLDLVFVLFDVKKKGNKNAVYIHWIALGIVIVYFLSILPVSAEGAMETYRWHVAHTLRQDYSSSVSFDGWLSNKVLLWMFYASMAKCTVFVIPGAVIRATERKIKKAQSEDT